MKYILVDVQEDVVMAWREAFQGVENVEVQHGSIFDVKTDVLVSPANSFGFMDGGLDMLISRFFGWDVQDRLQALIQKKHHGELLVGLTEIVETGHGTIPYMISAPTMRVPMILSETVNVYLATRAVFRLARYGRLPSGEPISEVVERIAIPGMGTGVGRVSPEICARQMKRAYEEIIEERHEYPDSWWEAAKRHQLLYCDSTRDLQR